MTICGYLARAKKSVPDIAELTGIPVSSLYRWKAEEEEHGFVRGIDADSLRKLTGGTRGAILADDVIGASRRKRAG